MIIFVLEELDEEVAEHHAVLLPILFRLLEDPITDIHADALNTLDVILENLNEAIQLYIQPLMEKLIVLLENSPRKVQIISINCIGSIAHAAGQVCICSFPCLT